MPTILKHSVRNEIGTDLEDIVSIPIGIKATVIGYNVVNVSSELVSIDSFVVDSSSTQAFYVKDLLIPPQTTVKLVTNGEKLVLDSESVLQIKSSRPDSIDVTVSYVEIS
jgi:hypothetical protein